MSRLRNLRLDIAYDGSDFFGWQRQPGRETIQGRIEAAIEQITGEKVTLTGSGRTDAGVHAAGQTANFKTPHPIPTANLARALNDSLPRAIRILRAREAAPRFHARYDATAKIYRYRILRRAICPPYLARFVHHYPAELDAERMERAAQMLEGSHDFTSFAAADGAAPLNESTADRPGAGNCRTLFSSRVRWNPALSLLTYEVRGSGFLRHMVRTIVGTLIEVGRGAMRPEDVGEILGARNRGLAGPTAAARGLCLVRVEYAGNGRGAREEEEDE